MGHRDEVILTKILSEISIAQNITSYPQAFEKFSYKDWGNQFLQKWPGDKLAGLWPATFAGAGAGLVADADFA